MDLKGDEGNRVLLLPGVGLAMSGEERRGIWVIELCGSDSEQLELYGTERKRERLHWNFGL